ncbi:TIGR03915 family putative DNA repair protein [Chryseobacterium sp.]|uniref:TIGR03915 family putative DNA repair protein n=1 Tax=Chryseobacterium sp. TaxID=1871047 RepID=UPI0011CC3C85|nr:TIGR03915 family putative DNA repair protein [Chryseobacterium sp.]TXF77323.1 DNA metabolism protein [Chryseobacterium sp.]
MTTLVYDGSFDGLFTAVFEVFEYRFAPAEVISKEHYLTVDFFSEVHEVVTDEIKVDRVIKKLEANLGKSGVKQLLLVYLSERADSGNLILSAVRKCIKNPAENILQNFADPDIMEISKICKSMGREIHRLHAFVRFEKLEDGMFFAKVEPDFNVLPVSWKFFRDRYADQKWMIYDLKRRFGVLYDLKNTEFFYPDEGQLNSLRNSETLHHKEEQKYQTLWQRYFTKTNITERKNMKLHIQHVPKRYWKYLTEKF